MGGPYHPPTTISPLLKYIDFSPLLHTLTRLILTYFRPRFNQNIYMSQPSDITQAEYNQEYAAASVPFQHITIFKLTVVVSFAACLAAG